MNINDYIRNDFNALTLENSIKDALELFKTYPVTHIPIIEKDRYIGCISQSDIIAIDHPEETLRKQQDFLDTFQINREESILELLQKFGNEDTNILPAVLQQKYIGYFELNDILDILTQSPFFNSDGFILIIQKNNKEYAMSEVAQIIESNKGMLLGAYISNHIEDKTELTLKIASQEINEIIQSFRRYKYTILTKHQDDFYLEELKNRSEYLQKFLNP